MALLFCGETKALIMCYVASRKVKALAACAFAAIALYACRPTYDTVPGDFHISAAGGDAAHGKLLVMNSCGGCHYNRTTGKFIGKRLSDFPKLLGKTRSANLTASAAYSPVPHYTDAELAYLLRTGIKRDGHFVPYMLRPNMADQDLKDILAYLRSGEGAVAATDTTVGHTHLNLLGRMGVKLIFKPQPFKLHIPQPATEVEQGRYLVDNISCFHCHSKKKTGLNYQNPEDSKGYLIGGMKLKSEHGTVRGRNLTPDKETGIGLYSKEDFRQAVQHLKARDGRRLRPPMEAFKLTDEEADAIYAYLHTLPPKHHKVKG
jgi:mono/diheme cytochrome c family protein